jgi:hypothetical protein
VRTDQQGRFCFVLSGTPPDRAEVRFEGDGYYAGAQRQFAIDLSPSRLKLELEVEAATWPLSSPEQRVRVSAHSHAATDARHPVILELVRAGVTRTLAEGHVSVNEPAEFTIDPSGLGPPGTATLVARASDTPSASDSSPIVISGRASLNWRSPLTAVRPELGFDVQIDVTSEHGPIESGWVETSVGNDRVGRSPVSAGVAVVSSRFIAAQQEAVEFRARYVPEHSWLVPGNDLVGTLPISRPPLWIHVPWLVVGALAAVWIFRAWWRPKRPRRKRASVPAPEIVPRPGAAVLEPGRPMSGWIGSVFDAHEGSPIAGARLVIGAPSVSGESVLTSACSDAEGKFSLSPVGAVPEGSRLQVYAPHHTHLSCSVPREGRVAIAMVSRRRAILEHLHEWAQTRGWDAPPLLTPARVAARARREERADTERWALRVEDVVFGPTPPDEEVESELTRRRTDAEDEPLKR